MKIKKTSRNGKTRTAYVKDDRFNEFLEFYGSGYTPEQIIEKLQISKSHYFQCVNMAEEFKENYLVSLAEHGIVLKHRRHLTEVEGRMRDIKVLIDKEQKKIMQDEYFDKHLYIRAISEERNLREQAVNLLGNASIVRGIEQLFVKLSTKNKELN